MESKKTRRKRMLVKPQNYHSLKPAGCIVLMVSYPECIGHSIYKLFTKNITCPSNMAVVKQACMFMSNILLICFTHNICLSHNPRKGGEYDATYDAWLGKSSRRSMGRNPPAFLLVTFLVQQAKVSWTKKWNVRKSIQLGIGMQNTWNNRRHHQTLWLCRTVLVQWNFPTGLCNF